MGLNIYNRATTLFELFSLLWQNGRGLRWQLITSFLLMLLSSLLLLLLPWFLKFIIEYLPRPNELSIVIYLLASYGVLWTFIQVLINVRQTIACRVFERSINKFCYKIFKNLLELPLSFYVQNATGNLMSAIERAQLHMPNVYFCMLFIIIPVIFEIFFAAFLLGFYYGLSFSFFLLLLLLTYISFSWYCIGWIVKVQRESNHYHRQVSTYITDILLNIEGIHYQLSCDSVLQECDKRLSQREEAVVRKTIRVDLVAIGQSIITGLCFTFMTLLAGIGVCRNNLEVSDFVLFNGYLLQFLIPLNMIGISVFRNVREGLTNLEDVLHLLKNSALHDKTPTHFKINEEASEIKFQQVTFCYPNNSSSALKDVTFTIPRGKTTAIVGTNGSGKSTLTKLIYNFYEPTSGNIFIQGKNIKNVDMQLLRKIIGIVPQEAFLLNDTIYKNLTLGDESSIDTELFQAIAQTTNLSQWIKTLPNGYNSIVGERGVQLSGGEKQRIGIARALLKRPKVLIFDEATSALDIDTEERIFSSLEKKYQNITKIFITHNLKILNKVDNVIYMKDGCVVSLGTHKDLLKNNVPYQRLWNTMIETHSPIHESQAI